MERRTLQDEIGKREPFKSLELEVVLNLARTADRLGIEASRLFKSRGISLAQYNVLRILRGQGRPLGCQEIASQMITHLPDITRLVDRLEAAGLATRQRTAEDRRVVLTRITEQGLKLLLDLDEPTLELHRSQLAHMSRAELEALNQLLVKARQPG